MQSHERCFNSVNYHENMQEYFEDDEITMNNKVTLKKNMTQKPVNLYNYKESFTNISTVQIYCFFFSTNKMFFKNLNYINLSLCNKTQINYT